tara:strand:- start:13 stop:249 length:237 start_codon:yes stop_codon:yes gene_type:complete
MWALIEDNTIVRTFNRPKPITINNIQHPRTIFTLWSEEELNTLGIYSITKNITSFNSKLKNNHLLLEFLKITLLLNLM